MFAFVLTIAMGKPTRSTAVESRKIRERRSDKYRFKTLQELLRHYGDSLPSSRIDSIILEAAQFFVCRISATPNQEGLQFIRRCEEALEAERILLKEMFEAEPPAAARPRKG
jgi:hypothetical protein